MSDNVYTSDVLKVSMHLNALIDIIYWIILIFIYFKSLDAVYVM